MYAPRFNYRLSDPAAALVLSQFRRLDQIVRRRRSVAELYTEALPPLRAADPAQRQRWLDHLRTARVRADALIPVHHLLHRQLALAPQEFPVAERTAQSTVSVPLFAALTDDQAHYVAETLTRLPE